MTTINDPVMGMTIPIAGSEPGTAYATEVSNDLQRIANHTHTGASNLDGYQVPSAGLNINADLPINDHNLTNVRAVRMQSQPSTLVGVGDVNCVYVDNGNLYFNNGTGVPVQITASSVVNVLASNNLSTKAISSNYTINPTDGYVVFDCDPTAGTILITLPLASSVPAGRFYMVKDSAGQALTHNITIQRTAPDTMDGGTTTVLDVNYQAATFFSDGVSNWTVWAYDRKTYHSGETLTLQSGSTVSHQGTDTFTSTSSSTHQSGSTETFQSGSTLNVNNGANAAINLSAGSTLVAQSGSGTEFKGGSAIVIDDTAVLQATLDTGSTITMQGTASLTATGHNTTIQSDGYVTLNNGAKMEAKSGSTITTDLGSTTTHNNTPVFNNGATFQGADTIVSIGNGVNTSFQSGSFLQMLTGSSLVSMFAGIRITTIDYSVGPSDFIILADATSNIVQITLPAASANPGRVIIVKDYKGKSLSVHNVKIVMTGLDKLDNISTSYAIQADWGCITCVSDGISVWSVISNSETAV